ncbi:MMPL family transporter OS=Stutzerimonas stutzeri OX=316 GN=G7024_19335 PE=4 SV=1 [Stutzerimonas stutzeri]
MQNFVPGALALLMNALGFGVIMLIDIPIVRELGLTACIGVMLMIVTNKLMLPIIISHMRLERGAVVQSNGTAGGRHALWWKLSVVATPGQALVVFAVSLVLLLAGTWKSRDLVVGDVGTGAPELRDTSRYNRDNAQIIGSYSIGLDVLSIYAEVPGIQEACLDPDVMRAVEQVDFQTRSIAGVQSVQSVAGMGKVAIASNNEGNPRWAAIPGAQRGCSLARWLTHSPTAWCWMVARPCRSWCSCRITAAERIEHVVSEIERILAGAIRARCSSSWPAAMRA